MSPEHKGALIRGCFTFGLVAAAVGAALWVASPGFGFGGKPPPETKTQQANPSNFEGIKNQKNCVSVIHCHQEDNRDSKKVQGILGELQRDKYGDEVRFSELNVKQHPELASKEGVATRNPQLLFYVQGQRVGDYRGPWDKPNVERKIDEILNGYLERIGKDWLPKVQGMERDRAQAWFSIRPVTPRS